MNLVTYLGKQVLGVMASYKPDNTLVDIACVYPLWNNDLKLFLPNGHCFAVDDLITVHLDNRTGVDEFDSSIRVYRGSYKGRVMAVDGDWIVLSARECQLFHGFTAVVDIRESDYRYPVDTRQDIPLQNTPLTSLPAIQQTDHENKVGILITHAGEQPHTTVLAFLSSIDDDIFLITFSNTFKSKLLKKSSHCYFVMDERASFTFEKYVEWNYTIVEGDAFTIAKDTPLFDEVREAFINKNPWEMPFFIRDDLEMYHIKKRRIIFPGENGVV